MLYLFSLQYLHHLLLYPIFDLMSRYIFRQHNTTTLNTKTRTARNKEKEFHTLLEHHKRFQPYLGKIVLAFSFDVWYNLYKLKRVEKLKKIYYGVFKEGEQRRAVPHSLRIKNSGIGDLLYANSKLTLNKANTLRVKALRTKFASLFLLWLLYAADLRPKLYLLYTLIILQIFESLCWSQTVQAYFWTFTGLWPFNESLNETTLVAPQPCLALRRRSLACYWLVAGYFCI